MLSVSVDGWLESVAPTQHKVNNKLIAKADTHIKYSTRFAVTDLGGFFHGTDLVQTTSYSMQAGAVLSVVVR